MKFYPLNLNSTILTSSVDFKLFLLNFRSQLISYVLSLAKKNIKWTQREAFGGLMASVEMEGVASVPPCRGFPFELGNKSSLFWSHQPNRLNTTEHFLLPIFMLNSHPQFFTDAIVCLEMTPHEWYFKMFCSQLTAPWWGTYFAAGLFLYVTLSSGMHRILGVK